MPHFNSEEGAALLKSGDFSDFKITCDNEEFLVHRNIISTKSRFLAACVKGDFKEAQTGVLDFPEEEPYVLAMALTYLYMGACGLETVKELWPRFKAKYADMQDDDLFFKNMVKLYKRCDRFMMQDLTKYAGRSMFEHCMTCDCWHSNGWVDPVTGDGYDKTTTELLKKRGSQLGSLLAILYEKLPEDTILRARAAVEALDVSRQQQFTPASDPDCGWDSLIVEILRENDLVAWNVARHYQKRLEFQHRRHGEQRKAMTRSHASWVPLRLGGMVSGALISTLASALSKSTISPPL